MSTAAHCVRATDVDHHQVRVVDVRTAAEFESSHIPGATNFPLDQLDDHVDAIAAQARSEEVILVCRAGTRAHQAQDRLVAAGLPELPILEGGMLAWEAAGLDVVVDVIRWDMERQLRLVTGSLVLASILLSVLWWPAIFIAVIVGGGLVYAAATNTCSMAVWLGKLPYNRPRTDVASATD